MKLDRFVPAVHWPSVRGRARADAGPLLLVAAVVAVVALLAGGTPPLLRGTSDDAVRDAIRRAPDSAAVQVDAEWADEYGPTGGRQRQPHLAEDVDSLGVLAQTSLLPSLQKSLRPPVTSVSTVSLAITDGSVQRRLRLEYLHTAAGGPVVTWVAGGPPRASTKIPDIEVPLTAPMWPIQVGLSEAEAAALKVRPGDKVPVQDDNRNPYNVRVSGIFRAADPNDPAWQLAPWALNPVPNVDGLGSTRLAGLLSAESLPDARLAFRTDQLRRGVHFETDPDSLTWESAEALAASVTELKAGSSVSADYGNGLKWTTALDSLLRDVRDQIAAASSQAAVLLIAVLAGALLVIGLTTELLTRRRAIALATARQRGASLPAIAAELALESAAVTVPAAALGLGLSVAATGGAALTWVVPFVLAALCAGPAYGVLAAARATRDRRVPANRSARRWAVRTVLLRRTAVDVAVLALAGAALVALHQRGVVAGGTGLDLPAAAPALVAVAASLLLVRLLPRATRLALRLALRSRRTLLLFGTARAASTASRVLPALSLTAAIALASFAVTLHATTERGLTEGAWLTVGADARLDLRSETTADAPELATRLAAAPGVRHAVAAQVNEVARFTVNSVAVDAELIVVDTAAYRALLADTPLPALPAVATKGSPIPALVHTSDGSLTPGVNFSLLRSGDRAAPLTAAGSAPGAGNVVIVDAAAGLEFDPNTIWITGPGAAKAATDLATGGRLTTLDNALTERRTAPLTAGLLRLYWVAAAVLLALGLLGFALAAAASAPQRWETLARLRTLGLRPRDTQRVAAAELLPMVVFAALCGPLLGSLLARVTLGPLNLRLLTAQTENPEPVVSWWTAELVTVAALAVVLVVVVLAESALRRRRRLGEVLRVGTAG
ncbi:FtsX-like permease family protein [Actinoplanes solisilvae]|uniref:FtsX-like permease family protein n=1 Tax=Actinoplanes solisilvae TaxID=2486853 RepID=UPI000FDA392A|nr:FtsX-like permease family protein [Actinoplanes solisilvae]